MNFNIFFLVSLHLFAANCGPSFQKPLYEGVIDSFRELLLEEMVVEGVSDNELEVELKGSGAELFTVILHSNGSVFLSLSDAPEEDMQLDDVTHLALVLSVVDAIEKLEASTAVIIEVQPQFQPRFTNDLYIGRLTDKLALKPLVIELKNDETVTIEVTFELEPRSSEVDDTRYFTVLTESGRAILAPSPELTAEAIWDRDHLEFNVVAKTSEFPPVAVPVVIGTPSQMCRRFHFKYI